MSEEEVAACLAKHLKKQAEQHQTGNKMLDGKLKRLTAPQRWAELKAWIKKTVDLTNKGTHAEAVKVYTIGRNEMRVDAAVCSITSLKALRIILTPRMVRSSSSPHQARAANVWRSRDGFNRPVEQERGSTISP